MVVSSRKKNSTEQVSRSVFYGTTRLLRMRVRGGFRTDPMMNKEFPSQVFEFFDNVKDNFTIMKQEPFGPLVPITTFRDYDEVIERANNHELGLASYVYTNSMEKAHRTSELMETGVVAVNMPVVAVAEAPFGGIKQTGYGREGGSMGIKDYLNIKYTHLGLK